MEISVARPSSIRVASICSPGYADVNELKHELDELAKEVHLPTSVKEAGIPKEGIEIVLEEGFHPERVTNNPRKLTKTELRRILESIYE